MYNIVNRKDENSPKVTTFDTNNLQSGEIIHMDFVFYNVTYIFGFTYMITVVCANTIIIWVFSTASKRAPFRIILFVLTKIKNEQQLCKHVRAG